MRGVKVHAGDGLAHRRPMVVSWAVGMGLAWAATAGADSSFIGAVGFSGIGAVVGVVVGLQAESEYDDGGWFGRRALPFLTLIFVVLAAVLAVKEATT